MEEKSLEVERELRALSLNCRELTGFPCTLDEYNDLPNSTTFMRHVMEKRPFICRGTTRHWAAHEKWTKEYLIRTIGDSTIPVAVTPTGRADALHQHPSLGGETIFSLPEIRNMTFRDLISYFDRWSNRNTKESHFCYFQPQNDSMRLIDCLKENLLRDIDPNGISYANEALGEPDAINFWLGQDHSVTSLHKDHYENLYTVIRGQKTFLIYQPTDYIYMNELNYRTGTFSSKWRGKREFKFNDEFDLLPSPANEKVPWISIDPSDTTIEPLRITVRAGETLYLPSMFFHQVTQENDKKDGYCLAVNYWYDMNYDMNYGYYQFMEKLCKVLETQ